MRGVDMSLIARMRRISDDDGMTLPEIMVAALLATVTMVSISAFLLNSLRAGAFVEGHSATQNTARNAIQNIEKETRAAETLKWCEPIGDCLEVGGQTPSRNYQTVRYTKTDGELVRQIYDAATDSWSAGVALVERVTNDASTPVFSCDTQSTLLRVNIDLRIEPTPRSDPSLQVTTSIRPRNFQSAAICP
jgi:type II secretory pathway component PulJ